MFDMRVVCTEVWGTENVETGCGEVRKVEQGGESVEVKSVGFLQVNVKVHKNFERAAILKWWEQDV